jgi:hypothetical protein
MKIFKYFFYINSYWNSFGAETRLITLLQSVLVFDIFLFLKKVEFPKVFLNYFVVFISWIGLFFILFKLNQQIYKRYGADYQKSWNAESKIFKTYFKILNFCFVVISFGFLIYLSINI